MNCHRPDYNKNRLKWILISLFLTLTVGTTFVLSRRNMPVANSINLQKISDSLFMNNQLPNKAPTIGEWLKAYEQKKWLETLKLKDRLDPKEIESLKEIDQELNELIHE